MQWSQDSCCQNVVGFWGFASVYPAGTDPRSIISTPANGWGGVGVTTQLCYVKLIPNRTEQNFNGTTQL